MFATRFERATFRLGGGRSIQRATQTCYVIYKALNINISAEDIQGYYDDPHGASAISSYGCTPLPGDDLSPGVSFIQLHVCVHAAFFRGVSGAGEDELAVAADGDAFVALQGVAGVGDGAAVDEDVLRVDQLLRFRAAQAVDHREYGVEALRGDGAGQLLPRGFEGAGGRRHDLAAH